MIPRFSLIRPASLDEAFDAFASAGGDAAYLAGGTELLQIMKMGFAQFGTLIDLKGIGDLRGIARLDDGTVRIGAGTTHRDIERSLLMREYVPAFAALEGRVANVRVRNTGTLGGNLAFAEPHSDPATFLLACGATVELAGPGGTRRLPVDEFVLGPLSTARDPEEIIVAVDLPPSAPGDGRGYSKIAFFERPAASVAVTMSTRDGAVTSATVAVGSLTEVPTIVPAAGAALIGAAAGLASRVPTAAAAFASLDIVADLNGAPEYKRHLAGVLLARAAQAALSETMPHA